MRITLAFIFTLLSSATFAQVDSLQFYYDQSKTAQAAHDTVGFYNNILKAHKLHPYHPTILYQSGLAAAMNKKNDEAFNFLQKAINLNAKFDLGREEFNSIRSTPEFQKLLILQKTSQEPIVQSDTAFVIKDRSLHIESISKGLLPNTFFCGCVHKRKIIMVDVNGKISDFTSPAQDGLTSVLGVKTEAKTKSLWACSSPLQEMENYDSTAKSAVFQYDIKTKKLLNKYIPEGNRAFVFGDLTIDPSGNVFVSDSKNNIVFKVNKKTKKLEEFYTSDEFRSLQGITFSTDGKTLFIADYIKGIYKLNVSTKDLQKVKETFDLSTKSIDGLTFYNNSLIAIQNYIYPMRVTQYFLDASQNSLTGYKIIDRAHQAFNEPTIGFADEDTFYYVANSLWSGYDDDHKLKPEDQLQDVVILKADLKKIK
jgi:DNA-binding beta-propeller fold protein YncE